MKKTFGFYLKLFYSMLYLSAFTFGGGYVIISFMRSRFVKFYGWITEEEMLDITAISQSAPGSIAVNASVMIGYRLAGLPGMLISILGTTLPPLVILSVVSVFYRYFQNNEALRAVLKGMNAGIGAIVIDAAVGLGQSVAKEKSVFSYLIMILSFIAVILFHIDVKLIILLSGLLGLSKLYYFKRKERRE